MTEVAIFWLAACVLIAGNGIENEIRKLKP